MITRNLTLPEVGLIAGTRVALGVGIGLLVAGRLNRDQRRAAGLSLFAVGALTTIPLAVSFLSGSNAEQPTHLESEFVAAQI